MIPYTRAEFGPIVVETIRCLQDNYVYFVGHRSSQRRAVIDPGEAGLVEKFVAQEKFQLELILNTHHHDDHIGGNLDLQEKFGIPAFASAHDANRIPGLTRGLEEGETFQAAGVDFLTLAIPGHTLGQVAFFNADGPLVFVGDTLFSMGCGRLFEGTPAQMLDSVHKLMRLPPRTHLFVGHEYTVRNGAFAESVEPGNDSIRTRIFTAEKHFAGQTTNAQILPTVTLAQEMESNPFLRADRAEIAGVIGAEASELAVFTRLREMRNTF